MDRLTLLHGNNPDGAIARTAIAKLRVRLSVFAIVSTALFGQLAAFEAASVRPHAAGVPGTYPPTGSVGTNDPERIVYNGFTLGVLLLPAFGVNHSYRILSP
jgi:hypothetical protein